MPSPTVIVAQRDPEIAQELASDLCTHFAHVAVAQNMAELRDLVAHHKARLAVLDMELVGIDEVHSLSALFGDLAIVCTHRSPDEQLWMSALNAGAIEFCHPQDLGSILRASRTVVHPHVALEEEEVALAA